MPRYLGDRDTLEVHDADRGNRECRLKHLPQPRRVWFLALAEAHRAGYESCAACIADAGR